ncbi:hydroxymethylglutaryl-CoA synthase [Fructobacillus pseudoficulneus]|uniref:Hydroxymethylglutaryl-CoA synthase n=1 Tax=Fructobacillus pseudoficulneus TaxID=220714 RepID=A0A3F3GTG0_9LACO|nr:hydroxymethylglutaryl-CoA synthase [Fructobacillus pseudoficulneus]GAP02187.1 hydroxymethylglutaryl-CoA synthase [Fructobacillus pseudoficulneus]SEH36017.1 hydroxymethylglutaryl-CoA synthase [Fructobacillus pseudoficulneus]
MAVGIDKLGFYTPSLALDLVELAKARGDEPDKYTIGIGQSVQTVVPNYEDVVTMGVNAAKEILTEDDLAKIEMLIFATESGIDNSKSAAVFAQELLGLSPFIRTIEMKQACYAGTYGLMQAKDFVTLHPDKKVLVIAGDIARYGLKTPGEVTQGAGAIAMVVSADPAIATINDDSVYMSRDVADFWRPVDSTTALVDGHLSTDVYKEMFLTLWQRYQEQTGHELADFAGFAFHLPYTKMGKKALDQIMDQADNQQQAFLREQLTASQVYNRQVGNLYTGSVYLALLSLLQQGQLTDGQRLGVFSYGSGAEAELFSLELVPGFDKAVAGQDVLAQLAQRQNVSVAEYEAIFQSQLFDSSKNQESDAPDGTGLCQFVGWQDGQRRYRFS